MAVEVKLPQLGESTYEGTIGKWLKKPGDRVERYEPLVEIITDKVNVEMPSPFEGTLTQILIPEGQTVPTGTPIALMDSGDGAKTVQPPSSAAAGSAQSTSAASVRPRAAAPTAEERTRLSPVVRKLAQEHGIALEELERLTGSGAG
jgi:pyruvate/2-oxoglutarate dehydrogenase complex dihydrolipoamide acyltransferase (E2) component